MLLTLWFCSHPLSAPFHDVLPLCSTLTLHHRCNSRHFSLPKYYGPTAPQQMAETTPSFLMPDHLPRSKVRQQTTHARDAKENQSSLHNQGPPTLDTLVYRLISSISTAHSLGLIPCGVLRNVNHKSCRDDSLYKQRDDACDA